MIIEDVNLLNPRIEVKAKNIKIRTKSKSISFDVSKNYVDDSGDVASLSGGIIERNLEDVKDEIVNVEGIEISAHQVSEALKLFFAKFYAEDKV